MEFVALEHVLHDMRLYKSPAEVKVMRRAAQIAAAAHLRAMRGTRPGMGEYEVEAVLLHEFLDGVQPYRRRRRQRLHPPLHREQRHA